MCNAWTNLMFRSCMVLSKLTPVIKNCQRRGWESISDAISGLRCRYRCGLDCARCVRTVPYELLCSYWVCGQVSNMIPGALSKHFGLSAADNTNHCRFIVFSKIVTWVADIIVYIRWDVNLAHFHGNWVECTSDCEPCQCLGLHKQLIYATIICGIW